MLNFLAAENMLVTFWVFWFWSVIKSAIFWLYLWQLKEYHIGRFLNHFKTHKGKKILLSPLLGVKIALLVLFLLGYFLGCSIFPAIIYILFILYFLELCLFFVKVAKESVKLPVFTFKVKFLSAVFIIGSLSYIIILDNAIESRFWHVFLLFCFDVLLVFIVSAFVLFFQPLFVLIRSSSLKKAKNKISQHSNLMVVGITGSYGKTSTKEFLTTILSSKFKVLSTPEHRNSEIGIAQTILHDLKPDHEIFIVEMGAYNKGGINLLCDIARPKIGVVTGVNEQHLATFGSLEKLLSAEGGMELAQNLPSDGLLVVNGENPYCVDLYKKTGIRKNIYTVKGDKIHSDIWADELTVSIDQLSFIARLKDGQMAHVRINVIGKQNAENLLGAILVARELGMSLEEISLACANIRQKQAGIILKSGVHGINIIDSSYSSNSNGVMADIDHLKLFTGKRIVAMPCLIELGDKSNEIHYAIGKKIAEVCDMAVITTKDRFRELRKGAAHGGMPDRRILLCDNPKEIFNAITTFCKEGDVVLLEGRVPNELIKLLHGQ